MKLTVGFYFKTSSSFRTTLSVLQNAQQCQLPFTFLKYKLMKGMPVDQRNYESLASGEVPEVASFAM